MVERLPSKQDVASSNLVPRSTFPHAIETSLPGRREARRTPGLPVRRDDLKPDYRAGPFLPFVATKLTQSPWFLNTPKVFQPLFLH